MAERIQIIVEAKDAASGVLRGVRNSLNEFGQQAAVTGGLLTAGVTLPLAAAAKTALSTAMDYQSGMNLFQAVSGATAAQMQQVGDKAIALGADMGLPATSAANAAGAMVELAKAGLSVNDIMGAAKGTLQLAAAGTLSEADAATITANALLAFNLKGEEASRVADLLAAAANASSAEVTDMADSLKMSSAVFAAAGIPIEDLTTALTEMANKGIKGSDAGTSLKQMLLSLQAPTKKSAGVIADLGIQIYDAQGAMLPMRDLIGQFTNKMGGLTQEQRNAALATIFGADAVRAANIVMLGGSDAFDQMKDSVTRQGAAAELAGAKMKGLQGALEGLKSQVETVMLEATTPFLGTLEGLTRGAADLIPKVTQIDPNLRTAALAFLAVLAAAGPVISIVGLLSTALAFLLSPLGLVVVGIAALAAAWAADFGGIREITAGVFGSVLATVQTVLPQLQATVMSIIGPIVAFWQENHAFIEYKTRETFQAVWSLISSVLGQVWGIIQQVLGIILTFWNQNHDAILNTVVSAWTQIQTFVQQILAVMQTIIGTVLGAVQGVIAEHGASIQGILTQAWQAIQLIIQVVLTAIQNYVIPVLQAIAGFIQSHANEIQTIISNVWTIIESVIRIALDIITGVLQVALAAMKGDWSGAWQIIQDKANAIWEEIKRIIDAALKFVNTLVGDQLKAVQKKFEDIWGAIQKKTTEIWDGITGGIKGSINSILSSINGLIRAWNRLDFSIPGFSIDIPSVNVPGVGQIGGGHLGWEGISIGTADIGELAMLAKGGLVTGPTLAMLGERGPEAVIPLTDSQALDALADRIASAVASRPTFVLQANYRYQDRDSLASDVRMLQLLTQGA